MRGYPYVHREQYYGWQAEFRGLVERDCTVFMPAIRPPTRTRPHTTFSGNSSLARVQEPMGYCRIQITIGNLMKFTYLCPEKIIKPVCNTSGLYSIQIFITNVQTFGRSTKCQLISKASFEVFIIIWPLILNTNN